MIQRDQSSFRGAHVELECSRCGSPLDSSLVCKTCGKTVVFLVGQPKKQKKSAKKKQVTKKPATGQIESKCPACEKKSLIEARALGSKVRSCEECGSRFIRLPRFCAGCHPGDAVDCIYWHGGDTAWIWVRIKGGDDQQMTERINCFYSKSGGFAPRQD
jgi:hypothetical protein